MKYLKLFEAKDDWVFKKIDNSEFLEWLKSHKVLRLDKKDFNSIENIFVKNNLKELKLFTSNDEVYIRSYENKTIKHIYVFKEEDDWFVSYVLDSDRNIDYYLMDGVEGLDEFFKIFKY